MFQHASVLAVASAVALAACESGSARMPGFTDLSPGPVLNGSTVPDHLPGFHFGAGAALDYDTHLEHFAVGFDALFRYTLARYTAAGGNSQTLRLPSLAVMPRIRYVF